MTIDNGFERFLVPLDGSAASASAIPYAITLASNRASIHLLTIAGNSQGEQTAALGELEEHRTKLAASESGPEITASVESGGAAEIIVDRAQQLGIDVIVMASSGKGALHRLAFGSVTDKVTRTARTPVMVVRHNDVPDGREVELERLIVPLDGSEIAERALPMARKLATQQELPITLLNVVDPSRAASIGMNYAASFSQELYEELTEIASADARKMLDGVAKSLEREGLEVQTQIAGGSPGETIVETAGQNDLVVMTTHGRGGIERLLIGSTAEHILAHGHSPVLLIPSRL